jgi:spore germination cell wall hydrolase CwlJ-like protein
MLTFVAMPASVGYQDLASTIAQRSSLSERLREHVIKSPFGTIHAATFSFPRPVGTGIPEPLGEQLASLDVRTSDITGSVSIRALLDLSNAAPSEEFTAVNRARKGDRIVSRALADGKRHKELASVRITAPPPAPTAELAGAGADRAELAVVAPPAALKQTALDERPVEIAALPPSSERRAIESAANENARSAPAASEPATSAPAASMPATSESASTAPVTTPLTIVAAPALVAPSAWDDASQPVPTDEAFASASMAWFGATAEPAAEATAEPRTATIAAEARAPEQKPEPAYAVASASAEIEQPRPAAPKAAEATAEPRTATITESARAPGPKPEPSYVVASASADIELPRPAAPKAEIAISRPQEQSEPPVDNRISDTESYRPDTAAPAPGETATPPVRAARIYFGAEPLADLRGGLEAWTPGETSLSGPPNDLDEEAQAAQVRLAALHPEGGETIVSKGEVPGDGRSLLSPADRLGLVDEERQKAEKCLADAVYFESRGEPIRGQIAVAQVIMNRVFSGYYPTTVCGVVYQNAHRRLACQFTFACDGIPDKITEPQAWERAKLVARETLDGKHWLPDVGKATHYHAYWVRPYWVRTMHKLDKIGVHTFYRPRNWGDGAAQPVWGDAELAVAPAEPL